MANKRFETEEDEGELSLEVLGVSRMYYWASVSTEK